MWTYAYVLKANLLERKSTIPSYYSLNSSSHKRCVNFFQLENTTCKQLNFCNNNEKSNYTFIVKSHIPVCEWVEHIFVGLQVCDLFCELHLQTLAHLFHWVVFYYYLKILHECYFSFKLALLEKHFVKVIQTMHKYNTNV